IINKQAIEALPKDLQSIVLNACKVVNADMLAEFMARNNQALETLRKEHGVQVRNLPDDVIAELKKLSDEVLAEVAGHDPLTRKVYDSFVAFRDRVKPWTDASEVAFLKARG
ncbi:MAG TPA: ABC transporter substrate-binding protein, partial [Chromatiales bacterium]|nr:ABC transporter substrate-binding protein [Chromatiales bacterium]